MNTLISIAVLATCLYLTTGDSPLCSDWARQPVKLRCKKIDLYKKFCPTAAVDACEKKQQKEKATPKPTTKKPNTTKKPKKSPQDEFTKCCQANGVPPECMAFCTYGLSAAELGQKAFCNKKGTKCETYLKVATYCGNNGKDHSSCCAAKGIKPICNIFCDGAGTFPTLKSAFDGLKALEYSECLTNYEKLSRCGKDNHNGNKEWQTKSWQQEQFPEDIAEYIAGTCGAS